MKLLFLLISIFFIIPKYTFGHSKIDLIKFYYDSGDYDKAQMYVNYLLNLNEEQKDKEKQQEQDIEDSTESEELEIDQEGQTKEEKDDIEICEDGVCEYQKINELEILTKDEILEVLFFDGLLKYKQMNYEESQKSFNKIIEINKEWDQINHLYYK